MVAMPGLGSPRQVTLRAYQVGFGDCFLLTFHYASEERHVLVDFGSTSRPKNRGPSLMLDVADDVKRRCGGQLHAVVATHRHRDHISGFATNAEGTAPGDVIASCDPWVVVQPWTEDPGADPSGVPVPDDERNAFVAALASMHAVSEAALGEVGRLRARNAIGRDSHRELTFLGEDNLTNESAVRNLMTMGRERVYVHYGTKSGLEDVLPGVRTRVLGPPSLEQSQEIRSMRSRDVAEYWHLQALAGRFAAGAGTAIFPDAPKYPAASIPPPTRWFTRRMRRVRAEQLLSLVRALDRVMNNTSLILLFEAGGKKLLFPGDAQIENWSYALGKASVRRLLASTDFYKVGHHGSLNATPKTLWGLFANRSKDAAPSRLRTVVSTMAGKHGRASNDTEVPRRPLVEALEAESDYVTTQTLTRKRDLYHEIVIPLGRSRR
jgi:hypothetical protein